MNFRTFTLLGAVTGVFALASLPSSPVSAAGALKLTGPEGQTRVEVSQYGPTTRADTFWSIAQKTRPNKSVSVYQVMAAIFEANPHAFTSDNYNSLEKGMILAIPSLNAIKAIPASLAKARAEQDDKAWQAMLRKEAQKPTPAEVIAVANAQAVEQASAELDKVSESLVEAQNRNLNLTDELGRALDQLVVVKNDKNNLKAKTQELTERVATLEQELIASRQQNQELKQKIEKFEWEASQAAIPQEQPSFFMSPLGLGIISAVVSLLLLTGLWLVLKRKSVRAAESGSVSTAADTGVGSAAVTADSFEQDEMVVQLEQSDDSLLDDGDVDLKPEADLSDDSDMYVADKDAEPLPELNESQSLDDLWAEAMGEQEESEASQKDEADAPDLEVEPQEVLGDDDLQPFDEDLDREDDDVDSLIAGLESDLSDAGAKGEAPAFDAEAIGSDQADGVLTSPDPELDETMTEFGAESGAEDDADPDALLAALSESTSSEPASSESALAEADQVASEAEGMTASELDTELDETMAEFGAEFGAESGGEDDADPEALLAALSESTPSEPASSESALTEADQVGAEPEGMMASELDSELDETMAEFGIADDADPEALLAALSESTSSETVSSEAALSEDESSESEPLMAEREPIEPEPSAFEHEGMSSEPVLESASEDLTVSQLDTGLEHNAAQFDGEGYDSSDNDTLLAELSQTESLDVAETDASALVDEQASDSVDEATDFSPNYAEDPLAELASLESGHNFSAAVADPLDDDDLLDSLDSVEGQTLSADDLDALDDNGEPLLGGVNPSVVPDLNQSELTNMTAQERSEKAMGEAMSRSELRARQRVEALARAKESEAEEPEVSEEEMAEMASMAPRKSPADQTRDDEFDTSLSLDAHDADMTSSDEELLAAFAQNSKPEEAYELPMDDGADIETENELLHGSNMTVEQALAALDEQHQEQEKEAPVGRVHFDEKDLANFQKENGYIDIDRLLNEADESEAVDNYQGPAEVAMDDYHKVMGDNAMVDVDDEENSVNAKLDLARAYIEIDDNDSARALLKEVALDGNHRQQNEARSLLDKIG
ncbi:MAG: hypothetical protein LPH21_16745 [Shewanella sp.]|nr:hypothetical protein [Shewanella sp.]